MLNFQPALIFNICRVFNVFWLFYVPPFVSYDFSGYLIYFLVLSKFYFHSPFFRLPSFFISLLTFS